jgi:hypothetical protein
MRLFCLSIKLFVFFQAFASSAEHITQSNTDDINVGTSQIPASVESFLQRSEQYR